MKPPVTIQEMRLLSELALYRSGLSPMALATLSDMSVATAYTSLRRLRIKQMVTRIPDGAWAVRYTITRKGVGARAKFATLVGLTT